MYLNVPIPVSNFFLSHETRTTKKQEEAKKMSIEKTELVCWNNTVRKNTLVKYKILWWYFVLVDSSDKRETEEFRLLRDLFEHYDKEVRPVYNTTDAVNVDFSLSLIQIISVVSC